MKKYRLSSAWTDDKAFRTLPETVAAAYDSISKAHISRREFERLRNSGGNFVFIEEIERAQSAIIASVEITREMLRFG